MKNTEKDFEQLASSIVEFLGGKDNVAHAGHCMTRLRVTPKDVSKSRLTRSRSWASPGRR